MDFIQGDVKKLYRKFLLSSMMAAVVMSIYSFVDTIAVGQSEGKIGAAAMAVITPFYGILVFLAILIGIGGSVLMSNARGEGNKKQGDMFFTAALILMGALTVICWIGFILFHNKIFLFFGADANLLPKVMEYAKWIIRFFPVFIAPTFISSFIRNDGAPGLAMGAVMAGGATNIFLDWFLVFPLGMGMEGAAIATVVGTSLQVIIMCSHFLRKSCRLKLVMPVGLGKTVTEILKIGFGASVLDLGTVILAILMNNQIMRYGSTTELAVYGVIATVTSLFQALFCGVGQAIQPLVSANHGAGEQDRIKAFWKMALTTSLVLGVIFTLLGEVFPVQLVKLFVDATPEIITAAPGIVRLFFLLFIPLGMTVLSTYFLQSVMRDKMSVLIALLRSAVISGILIIGLPIIAGITGVWIAMPTSETIVAVVALLLICRVFKNQSTDIKRQIRVE